MHDVETIFHIRLLLTASGNLMNADLIFVVSRALLIFQERFPDVVTCSSQTLIGHV